MSALDGPPAPAGSGAAAACDHEGRMELTRPQALSSEEAERLDAEYRPFPPLDRWPLDEALSTAWDRTVDALRATAKEVRPDDLQRALNLVMRAAALDTGAIEGLYSVDQGFTITVATQAAAWQEAVAERGPQVRALFEAQLATYQLVLDAATRRLPVTEALIRRIHEELCRPQETYRVLTPVGEQE